MPPSTADVIIISACLTVEHATLWPAGSREVEVRHDGSVV
jgi:hypothetical protein